MAFGFWLCFLPCGKKKEERKKKREETGYTTNQLINHDEDHFALILIRPAPGIGNEKRKWRRTGGERGLVKLKKRACVMYG